MGFWNTLVDRVAKGRPKDHWSRGPYITSAAHALITVLGLMPYPFGTLGIVFFLLGESPLLWLGGSTLTCGWYWRREYKQTGLRPKHKLKALEGGVIVKRTFGQRYDTWMDVLFPTVALGFMYGVFGWLL